MVYHGYNYGWGMMGDWRWLFGLIFFLLVVWIIIRFVSVNIHENKSPDKSAMEILKERYARGEITKKEFESIKDDIR